MFVQAKKLIDETKQPNFEANPALLAKWIGEADEAEADLSRSVDLGLLQCKTRACSGKNLGVSLLIPFIIESPVSGVIPKEAEGTIRVTSKLKKSLSLFCERAAERRDVLTMGLDVSKGTRKWPEDSHSSWDGLNMKVVKALCRFLESRKGSVRLNFQPKTYESDKKLVSGTWIILSFVNAQQIIFPVQSMKFVSAFSGRGRGLTLMTGAFGVFAIRSGRCCCSCDE